MSGTTRSTGSNERTTDPSARRKLIAFDAETWAALDLLRRDSFKTLQELADEAFADLLKKHHRPTDLKSALRESVRAVPTTDRRKRRLLGEHKRS
jgi:hypothetical protein